MPVGSRDQATVLTWFDGSSAVVFATLCHLTAGDHHRARELLVATFASLPRAPAEADDRGPDRRTLQIATHRAYLFEPTFSPGHEKSPVSSLSPLERVALNLTAFQNLSSTTISALMLIDADAVDAALASGARTLSELTFGEPIGSVFGRCEVWFDDVTRQAAREILVHRIRIADDVPASIVRRVPRGARVAAVVALAALIAVAVGAWLAPSNTNTATNVAPARSTTTEAHPLGSKKDPSELPAVFPTESTTSGSADNVGGSSPSGITTGFVVDPLPAGYSPASAQTITANVAHNWLEVWSTPGATRTQGRWFAVTVANDPNAVVPVMRDARRLILNGIATIIGTDPASITRAEQQRTDSITIRFESFGFEADQVEQLIAGTSIEPDASVTYSTLASGLLDGLQLQWSGHTEDVGFVGQVGQPSRQRMAYVNGDASNDIFITSGPQVANDLVVSRLLNPAPPQFFSDPNRMGVLNDRRALLGELLPPADRPPPGAADQPPMLFAMWHDGTQTITIASRLSLFDLLNLARSVRRASKLEWEASIGYQRALAPPPHATGTQFVSIGTTLSTLGDTWTIAITDANGGSVTVVQQVRARPASTDPRPDNLFAAYALTPDPQQPLVEFASYDATVLAIVFDAEPTAAALRVTAPGRTAVDIPIVRTSAPMWWGAGYAFSEVGPYTAALVDGAGNVLQQLTPLP